MKPKPTTSGSSSSSISISSNPNPNRKPKANNVNEEHRRYPLQHLNLKTTRTRTATTSTSTRSGRLRITPGDSLRFPLSHSSSSTCSSTSSKTNNPKLPCISKHKCGPKPKPISRNKKNKNLTPLLGKIPTSTSESATQANDTNSKTPPVQASVSPDLPVILQSTSTCYGAGHLFSGASDKRKCRPKGLLAVHSHNAINDAFKDKAPLPLEASMHWLLSPSNSISPSHFDFSPSSTCKPSFDLLSDDSSPSTDSLGSANVIRTPLSDSSSDKRLDLPHLTRFHSQLCSVVEALRMSSLSPNTTEPNRDKDNARDSIALSFQFDSPTTSCSSVFLSQIHRIPDDHQASWNSCSTWGNESHSQMRISWREGLMSQIDEMDEFDSCRCLSDQEEDANGCPNDVFRLCEASDIGTANPKSDQILTISDCCYAKISDNETRVEGKGQENYPSGPPQLSCSCADSISTDGGGLLASSDSDWVLSYKD